MSITAVPYPIIAALVRAESMEGMGPNRVWLAVNNHQEAFLRDFFKIGRGEVGNIPEIESLASWKADELNALLLRRGFGIQLQPFNDKTFGVVSILDLPVKWIEKGDVTTIKGVDSDTYPAVHLGFKAVSFVNASGHTYPIARISTMNGLVVAMTMVDQAPQDEFDLSATVERIRQNLTLNREFGGLVFPMVTLDQTVDISWLVGLCTVGEDARRAEITQALQQTKLKMNEVGARAESAAAIAVTREMAMVVNPDLVIDRPFIVWFEREGLSKSLFAAYVTEADWRSQGSIER